MISNTLFGLVLSAGKSTRMGRDKGLISYHGIPQRYYLYQILNMLCGRTFLSIRADQEREIGAHYGTIIDANEFQGPYNGLLSAHKTYPDAAWLVVACDMPLLDTDALKELISQRDKNKMATAFANASDLFPEPLCAIWEPIALTDSLRYLRAGLGTGPRKFLMNANVKLVVPKRPEVVYNANSEQEYAEIRLKLNK